MRLPNGYGSVYKMSGNRRKPYAIAKTVGRDKTGKQIRKIIGYAKTKEEGLKILAEFNDAPWDVDKSNATFDDVFELLQNDKSISSQTLKVYRSHYNVHCQSLYGMKYRDLRTYHFKNVLDNIDKSNGTKNSIVKFFRSLDKTAINYDIITKGYSYQLKHYEDDAKPRVPFTESEIQTLWDNENDFEVQIVLVMLYTGFRLQEFLNIKVSDVDFDNWTITGGSKTKAGKNRVVPIHKRIRPIVKRLAGLSLDGKLIPRAKSTFYRRFYECMQNYNMKHIPHECRHTLRSRMDDAGANKKCIDLILGHTSEGTGERIYTHKTIEQLHEAINMIS